MGELSGEEPVQDIAIMTQNQLASNAMPSQWFHIRNRGMTIFWGLLSVGMLAYLLVGVSAVPFHPDESTWIYMSADWERLQAAGPMSITWSAAKLADPLQVEREQAAPLTRDVIGIARSAAGQLATEVDWNWSLSWEANAQNGALPNPALLWVARLPQVIFLWLTVLMLAWIAGGIAGNPGAVVTAITFGFNAQVLLHLRRAMSESLLLFGIALVVLAALRLARRSGRPRFWSAWLGVALAVVVSSKLSGVLILPAAAAGCLLAISTRPITAWLKKSGILMGVACLFGLLTFAILNPLYWSHPLEAANSVIQARRNLQAEQTQAMEQAGPGWVLSTIPIRALGMTYEALFAAPAYWDVPNYSEATKAAEDAYSKSILSGLPASMIIQALWCLLVMAGLLAGAVHLRDTAWRNQYFIIWIWGLATAAGILWGVSILWQRYYILQIPILSVWAGVGASWLASRFLIWNDARS
jgi:hypothetical protein